MWITENRLTEKSFWQKNSKKNNKEETKFW